MESFPTDFLEDLLSELIQADNDGEPLYLDPYQVGALISLVENCIHMGRWQYESRSLARQGKA